MFRLLFVVLCCALASCAAGRLSNKYLPQRQAAAPAHQYLAPKASHLHYHGVSGQAAAAQHAAPAFHAHAGHAGQLRHGARTGAGSNIPIVRSDYQSDANGNYNFGYDTGNGIHRDETGEFNGGWPHGSLGVRGSYSYTGDDGQQYTVNYKADKDGFHAEGAHLPTSPSLPAAHYQAQQHHQHAAYHAAASNVQSPATRYLPPAYRQRRHY